ncbi:hypothetical protein X975_08789, partial [Stegodyphus mimosarum]
MKILQPGNFDVSSSFSSDDSFSFKLLSYILSPSHIQRHQGLCSSNGLKSTFSSKLFLFFKGGSSLSFFSAISLFSEISDKSPSSTQLFISLFS